MWQVGETFRDDGLGVSVSIDSETENGFVVTVSFDEIESSPILSIPDPSFKSYLVENFDCNSDGEIDESEALKVEAMVVSNNVAQLTGVEKFTNLAILNCAFNRLTALPDLSPLTQLHYLNCGFNQLTTMPELSALTQLQQLHCFGNQLTEIPDLSRNLQLRYLDFSGNLINRLPDLSGLSYLGSLNVTRNRLDAGACEAARNLENKLPSFFYRPQLNRAPLNCMALGVHLTRPGKGFEGEILIRNPDEEQKQVTLHPFDSDGAQLASEVVDVAGNGLKRFQQNDVFSSEAARFTAEDDNACVFSVGYRASIPQASTAHVHQTVRFQREFSFYAGDWDQLFDGAAIVNMGSVSTDVFVSMYGVNGDLKEVVRLTDSLSPGAKQLFLFNDVLPQAPLGLMKLQANQPVAATFLRFSKDNRFLYQNLPLPSPSSSQESRWLPHITSDGGGFDTKVALHNTSENVQTITFQFFNPEGQPLEPRTLTVEGHHSPLFDKDEIFPPGASHAVISGDSACLVSLGYRAQLADSSTAMVHEGPPVGDVFFIYPGEWDLLYDGLSIVNTGEEPAMVVLSQIDQQGEVLKTVILEQALAPNAKHLSLLETSLSSNPQAIVKVKSTQPMAIMALRLSKDKRFLYGNQPLPK